MLADAFARITRDIVDEALAFRLTGTQARLAACASFGATGAVLAALALNLDEPWWAGISAVSILQAGRRASFARATERILGTVIGAAIGFALAPLVSAHLVFALICAMVAGVTIYVQERVTYSYAVLLGGVTALLVLFGTLESPDQALYLAVYRATEVMVGIVVGSAVSYVLHPVSENSSASVPKAGVFAFSIDRELLGVAVSGGIAMAVIPYVWTALALPGFGQTPITAFVVLTALRSDPGLKALSRLVGCCLGGIYGLLAIGLVGDAFVPWTISLLFGLYAACFLQHGGGDASYAGQQAAVVILTACVTGPAASPDVWPAIDRFVGIVGGIAIVSLVMALLDPLRLRLAPAILE